MAVKSDNVLNDRMKALETELGQIERRKPVEVRL